MAPDGQAHSDCSEPWRDRLGAYKLAHPERVAMVKSSAWVRNPEGIDRIADIAVYLRQEATTPQIPDRVPEIAFEIVSPGPENRRRDYVDKRRDYHALGIAEYVIIDRFDARVTILTHTPDGYAERVLTVADTYESPRLPGFAVPLAEVFGG